MLQMAMHGRAARRIACSVNPELSSRLQGYKLEADVGRGCISRKHTRYKETKHKDMVKRHNRHNRLTEREKTVYSRRLIHHMP